MQSCYYCCHLFEKKSNNYCSNSCYYCCHLFEFLQKKNQKNLIFLFVSWCFSHIVPFSSSHPWLFTMNLHFLADTLISKFLISCLFYLYLLLGDLIMLWNTGLAISPSLGFHQGHLFCKLHNFFPALTLSSTASVQNMHNFLPCLNSFNHQSCAEMYVDAYMCGHIWEAHNIKVFTTVL